MITKDILLKNSRTSCSISYSLKDNGGISEFKAFFNKEHPHVSSVDCFLFYEANEIHVGAKRDENIFWTDSLSIYYPSKPNEGFNLLSTRRDAAEFRKIENLEFDVSDPIFIFVKRWLTLIEGEEAGLFSTIFTHGDRYIFCANEFDDLLDIAIDGLNGYFYKHSSLIDLSRYE